MMIYIWLRRGAEEARGATNLKVKRSKRFVGITLFFYKSNEKAIELALDQGLDSWLEQNLQLDFEQAAQYHMRYIAQERAVCRGI